MKMSAHLRLDSRSTKESSPVQCMHRTVCDLNIRRSRYLEKGGWVPLVNVKVRYMEDILKYWKVMTNGHEGGDKRRVGSWRNGLLNK